MKKLWESVAYMGMKPGSAPMQSRVARLFGPFRGSVERFLAGGLAPSDPLYLTNRTIGQRLRLALVVSIPCLILVGILAVGVSRLVRVRDKEQPQMTSAEIAAKMLPSLAGNIEVASNRDLEVVEARVEPGHIVAGRVKNNTDRPIDDAEVIFDLTDQGGGRLGAVKAVVAHVDAKSTATFRVTVEQETAAFALVREVVLK